MQMKINLILNQKLDRNQIVIVAFVVEENAFDCSSIAWISWKYTCVFDKNKKNINTKVSQTSIDNKIEINGCNRDENIRKGKSV